MCSSEEGDGGVSAERQHSAFAAECCARSSSVDWDRMFRRRSMGARTRGLRQVDEPYARGPLVRWRCEQTAQRLEVPVGDARQ